MNSALRILAIVLVSACFSVADESAPKHNYIPEAGYVPDESTAIAVAVAVWSPIYGKKKIEDEAPYKAELRAGTWHVFGTLKAGWKGGVAEAEIRKCDAGVIRVSHGR